MTVQPHAVHLRNGKTNDCAKGKANSLANLTPGSQSYIDYNAYLINSGCKKTVPAPGAEYWGSDTQTIPVAVGQSVVRGQVVAWAGNTGPGGKRGASLSANTHLHLFTTRKVRPRSAATFGSHHHRSLALASKHALSATIRADILLGPRFGRTQRTAGGTSQTRMASMPSRIATRQASRTRSAGLAHDTHGHGRTAARRILDSWAWEAQWTVQPTE